MKKDRVRRVYIAAYLITPDHIIRNGAVLCENDKIIAVGGVSGFNLREELEVFRFEHAYITPGFLDTHVHGAGGCDCSRVADSIHPLEAMSHILGCKGAAGFFPTVVADAPDTMIGNLRTLVAEMKKPLPGADAIGINIEGPFLNPGKAGAQPPKFLREIDLKFAADLIDAGEGLVRIMTFAPELPDADKLIALLRERGVIASMGHSLAGEEETLRAIDAGANHCTHLFNGMNPLHQRQVGLPGIVLTDDRVTVELIIDGRHVHSRMVDLACRCKGVSFAVLDCMDRQSMAALMLKANRACNGARRPDMIVRAGRERMGECIGFDGILLESSNAGAISADIPIWQCIDQFGKRMMHRP